MEDVTNKIRNTAKMLGATSLEALNFGDACFILRNNINKELKEKARKTILGTILLDKPFEKWLEEFYAEHKAYYEKELDPEITKTLMTIEATKEEFVYGLVENILSTLITKQFHEKAA